MQNQRRGLLQAFMLSLEEELSSGLLSILSKRPGPGSINTFLFGVVNFFICPALFDNTRPENFSELSPAGVTRVDIDTFSL